MDYMYTGNLLVVDLEKGETEERLVDEDMLRSKLGGAAVNDALFKEFESKDPVIVGAGLFTSSMIPGSSMSVMTARSPIADRKMHCPIVNLAGAEVKLAGFDFIVLHGTSPKPVYLWLHDEIADLLPAEGMWGRDTWHTADHIREEQGEERIQVISIGPAGEKRGSIGQLIVDYWSEGDKVGFGRRFGEMGLKAIGTRGMGELELADPEKFLALCLEAIGDARKRVGGARGIDSLMPSVDMKNLMAVRHRDSACFGCPWPCRTYAKYNEPPTVLREALEEPGVLIADAPGFAAMLTAGFDAVETSKLLEVVSRLGIEPVGAALSIEGLGFADAKARLERMGSEKTDVRSIPTVEGACRPDLFSPFAPNGGDEETIALAYILGVCPRFAAKMGIDRELVSKLIEACAEVEIRPDALGSLARSILL
ncbi:MAG: hypothetical protein FJ151_01920 [Euryarchaeota archaeon]|nr:hypothetical protein [Euryarchaeota archaeon]